MSPAKTPPAKTAHKEPPKRKPAEKLKPTPILAPVPALPEGAGLRKPGKIPGVMEGVFPPDRIVAAQPWCLDGKATSVFCVMATTFRGERYLHALKTARAAALSLAAKVLAKGAIDKSAKIVIDGQSVPAWTATAPKFNSAADVARLEAK